MITLTLLSCMLYSSLLEPGGLPIGQVAGKTVTIHFGYTLRQYKNAAC